MHPPRVTVWCAFWAGGVIGPYFFENAAGNALNVNGARYRKMLTEFLWPDLDHIDVQDMFFQQDGACDLPHSSRNNGVTAYQVSRPCHLSVWR